MCYCNCPHENRAGGCNKKPGVLCPAEYEEENIEEEENESGTGNEKEDR